MAAPATEGQFGDDITMNSWKKAMEQLVLMVSLKSVSAEI